MSKQQKATNTKDQILQAAYDIFLQKGINAAGIKEITDRAEVNKAMLYYYFDSKEHLYTEVFRKAINESALQALHVLEEHSPLFEKIRVYINTLTDTLLDTPVPTSFVMNELNRHPKELHNIIGEEVNFDRSHLDKQLKEAADNYEIARIDSRQLLANITTLCLSPVINQSLYSVMLEITDEEEYVEFLKARKGIIYDMTISWLTS